MEITVNKPLAETFGWLQGRQVPSALTCRTKYRI